MPCTLEEHPLSPIQELHPPAFQSPSPPVTLSHQALEPSRDLPLAILGSLGLTTALYVAASACIVALVPRGKIDTHAAFSVAFTSAGLEWVARAVSAGALAGEGCNLPKDVYVRADEAAEE